MRQLSALLIALAGLAGCDQWQADRYQIVAAPSTREDKVWLLDTRTGRVRLCFESAAAIRCVEPSVGFTEPQKSPAQ